MMQIFPNRTQGLTEWFDQDENYFNHILWLSQSLHLNLTEHIQETLEQRVDNTLAPLSKH